MDKVSQKFTHLHVHSHYSLLDGLAKINQLVDKAKEYNMPALALTDHGNLYGAVEFYKQAKAAGLKPILGLEAYVTSGRRQDKTGAKAKKRHHLILLAKNETGWKNLIQLVTLSNLEGFYYKPRIDHELIVKYHEGLICLSGCVSGEVGSAIKENNIPKAEEIARWYQSIFGADYYLEIQPHTPELHKPLADLGKRLNIGLVATQDIHYVNSDDKTAHEILLSVQTNNALDDPDRMSLKQFDLNLKSGQEMMEIFKSYPEAIGNTYEIAQKCNLEIELGKNHIPRFNLPAEFKEPMEYLRHLIKERVKRRYPEITPEIQGRLDHELKVIEKTGFADYFLIVQDFVNWAKDHGIVVGPGRGSAAGSLVSYVLGITNVDPIKYELLFERFLNPDRIQVPDIDIDFTDLRRDEVIAYVREKYGQLNVAQIITFGTMMARAAVRDTGRALGLSYGFCDKIAKLIPFNTTIETALKVVPDLKKIYQEDPKAKELIDSAIKLEGTVRHASVHACGLVISERPLTEYVPLQRAPQGSQTIITQFDMHGVENVGLLKMDFLGLKNLTIIEEALKLIEENKGVKIDINNLPLDDKKTFKLFQQANTVGIFQLESDGMRRYLKELRPSELEDIIAMIALYRPGPMELIPLYIRRKHGKEKVTYLHPKLEPILKSTYGVGIYQEQMMRIARDLAGYTLAEADILRKAIGKKIKKLLAEQKTKLITGMVKNGIDKKTAERIWELFPPFARYGFNRSHSASYAVISYQTAYLKAHYPVEFLTSWLNVSASDIDRINELVNEARHLGIKVLPPDINLSIEKFSIDEDGESIRFGLLAVKNLGLNIVREIIKERGANGPFKDLTDFLTRICHRDLNKKSLESLIKCGALDSLGVSRTDALFNLNEIIKFNQEVRKHSTNGQNNLFGHSHSLVSLKLKPAKPIDKFQILRWEKEMLGLYLTEHPFTYILERIKNKIKPIRELNQVGTASKFLTAGVISSIQRFITKRGDPMLFVTLEDDQDNIEILVFSDVLAGTESVWEEGQPIVVEGRLSKRNGEQKIICSRAKALKVA